MTLGMGFNRVRVSSGDEVVVHTEFPESAFGRFDFLFGDPTFRGDLDGEFQLQPFGGGELRQNGCVELHPLLRGDFPDPGHVGESELLGLLGVPATRGPPNLLAAKAEPLKE